MQGERGPRAPGREPGARGGRRGPRQRSGEGGTTPRAGPAALGRASHCRGARGVVEYLSEKLPLSVVF